MSKQGTTDLYNQKVTETQRVDRPMASGDKKDINMVHHQGVKATTESGKQVLIHNTPGNNSKVTDAANMSGKWNQGQTKSGYDQTVGNLMEKAQSKGKYNLLTNNCKNTASDVMKD